jgi:translocation protein SEC63
MLDYDDSAFFYFSLALLSVTLLPYWYFTLKTLLKPKVIESEGTNCQTKWFQDLIRTKKKNVSQSISKGMIFRLLIGIFFTWLWYLNFSHVSSIEGLQSFDPYAILDLPFDADEKAIRKQYRRMSLTLHPDKNPDNPLAV